MTLPHCTWKHLYRAVLAAAQANPAATLPVIAEEIQGISNPSHLHPTIKSMKVKNEIGMKKNKW